MSLDFDTGSVNVSLDVQIVDDTGLPVTGLVAATMPAIYLSKATGADIGPISLSDLGTLASAHSDGGVKERGQGFYRFDAPDSLCSTAGVSRLRGEASGKRLIVPAIRVGFGREIRAGITEDHGTGSYVAPAGALSGSSLPTFQAVKFVYGDMSQKTIEVLDANGDAVELPDPDVEVMTLAIETYDHQDVYVKSTDDAEDPIEIDEDAGTVTLTPTTALVFLEHDTQLTISLRGANNREIARGSGYIAYSALNNAEEPSP